MDAKQLKFILRGLLDLNKAKTLDETKAVATLLLRYVELEGLANSIPNDTISIKLGPWNRVGGGTSLIEIIKNVRSITGLGLKESKDLCERGGMLPKQFDYSEAVKVKSLLESLGASVEFIGGSEMLNMIYGN